MVNDDPVILMAGIPKDSEFPSGSEKPFMVPAISMDKKVGELQVGHTSLDQALKILLVFPDHSPTPRTGEPGPEIIGKNTRGQGIGRSRLQSDVEPPDPAIRQEQLTGACGKNLMEEVYKKSTTTLQGEVRPCITLEILLNDTGEPNPIAYMYTCSTNRT